MTVFQTVDEVSTTLYHLSFYVVNKERSDYLIPEDRVGQTIGIYTIIRIDRSVKNSNKIYVCKCNYCENIFIKQLVQIKRPSACTHLYISGNKKDYNFLWEYESLRSVFNGMKVRCYNESDKDYRWYGKKGIKICDEWLEHPKLFEDWAISSGYKKGLTIDRIDCDGNYCPENCRWVTLEDNSKYKSTTRILTVNGESHTGSDWADILKIGATTVNKYVRFYGVDDTQEFIRRFLENTHLADKRGQKESLFDLYMS